MSASDIVNAIIKNEPAQAVDYFQNMVRERAREMVVDRYYPQAEEPIEEVVQDGE